MPLLAGLFVGGQSRRMHHRPKGLLVTPDGDTIVARFARLFGELGVPCVLVGANEAYAGEGLPMLADAPFPSAGPLAGLVALLERAQGASAIAVACDMPYVSSRLLARLMEASPGAAAVAARRDGRWEPFFARYDASRAAPVARARAEAGQGALQGLLDALGAVELPTSEGEGRELRDWDTPDDVDA